MSESRRPPPAGRLWGPVLAGLLAIWVGLVSGVPVVMAQSVAVADPYVVTGVAVDVTADNALAARDRAIAQAQRSAFATLYQRLTRGGGAPPPVDDIQLHRLVRSFEVEEERTSAVRYVGTLSVAFRPDAVQSFLGATGQAVVEPPRRPLVVLPVQRTADRAVLWDSRTPWREAWEDRQGRSGLVPFVVPLGELADIADIGVDEALNGVASPLQRIAGRYGADGVIVTVFDDSAEDGAAEVDVVRYDDGIEVDRTRLTVSPPAAEGTPDTPVRRGADAVIAALETLWKRGSFAGTGRERALDVQVPVSRLRDWVTIRSRLRQERRVSRIDLRRMSTRRVDLVLHTRGSTELVQAGLARRGLMLSPIGPAPPGGDSVVWTLVQGEPTPASVPPAPAGGAFAPIAAEPTPAPVVPAAPENASGLTSPGPWQGPAIGNPGDVAVPSPATDPMAETAP